MCLARKFLRRPGSFFLIFMFGSPNRTILVLPPSLTQTADFFGPPGVLQGLFRDLPLHGLATHHLQYLVRDHLF